MRNNKLWFTFVELIVVITILAILASIWFISYSWYIAESRDASRLSQISSIHKALESYRSQWYLPVPDNNVNVNANGSLVWYQWYAWENVINKIWYQDGWTDPKDKIYFTYYLTKDLRRAQLMTFLENEVKLGYSIFNKANASDYTDRVVKVYWDELWILIEDLTSSPIQEVNRVLADWSLDVVNTTNSYTAYISDNFKVTWTWWVLAFLRDWAWKTCNDIINKNSSKVWKDWVYYINPTWNRSFEVYCDMSSGDWGWTMVANIQTPNTAISATRYENWFWTIDFNNLTTWNRVMDVDWFNDMWEIIRVDMWTVKDFYKPTKWNNIKTMILSNIKHLWSNSLNWEFKAPSYYFNNLWWSQENWPIINVPGDWRKYLSVWWSTTGSLWWCCSDSINSPSDWWGRKYKVWIR